MLIQTRQNSTTIKFNNRFYDINAIIAANTKFSADFSTEVNFAILSIGRSLYHQVKLTAKKNINQIAVYNYINEVLSQSEYHQSKNNPDKNFQDKLGGNK